MVIQSFSRNFPEALDLTIPLYGRLSGLVNMG